MVPELEKPKITEIKVRMDCNGCVQKIKKALHGINGIYDLYIDFPQQKLTIIGWADPEKIVKAIKKARKTATICSHSEVPDPPPAQPSPPEQQDPPPEEAAPPTPPAEPPKDQPPEPENPPPTDAKVPSNEAINDSSSSADQPTQTPPNQKEVEAVHFVYNYQPSPPDHGYRSGYRPSYRHNYGYPARFQLEEEPRLINCDHNYNTYNPSPSVTHTYNTTYNPSPLSTEYNYIRSPPRYSTYYPRAENIYNTDDYNYNSNSNNNNNNGNINSLFSDENPNACRII